MGVLSYTLRAELHTRKDEEKSQSFLFERRFEEEISLLKETDNLREYKVNIHSQEGSNVEFQQYNGQIIMCKNEHLPLSAEIEVVFKKEDIANQWYFKLKRN